jgi:hypothetical protein
MAIKVTLLKDGNDVFGGRNRIQHASIDLDNSYPTGGYVLPATYFFGGQAKAANIWNVIFGDAGTTGGGAYRYYYDIPNGKLMVYRSAGFTPAGTIAPHAHDFLLKDAVQADGATTRVNAATNKIGMNTGADVTVAGAGANGGVQNTTAVFTGTAVAAGALVQVANATDLSAIVGLRMTVFGR